LIKNLKGGENAEEKEEKGSRGRRVRGMVEHCIML